MVEQALNDRTACIKCHVDKRGPFVFEHPPVRVEGCETCHNPHGSMNAKLLRRPVVFTVCLECHNGSARLRHAQSTACRCNLASTTCWIRNSRNAPRAT